MSTFEKINELSSRRLTSLSVSRQRIIELLDDDSFVELGSFTENAGVATGYGAIGGRLVYVYSQEGPVNVRHAKKIISIYSSALKVGAPVIGILDSKGLKLDEGMDTLEAYGTIFSIQAEASGVIPQISVVLGDCMGMASFVTGLSDFVFMIGKNSKMFLESPNTYSDGKLITTASDGIHHSQTTGLVHFSEETEGKCLDRVRELFSYIPSNNLEDASFNACTDDLNRIDPTLNEFFYDEEHTDTRKLVQSIVDNGDCIEIQKDFAPNVIVSFGKFAGYTGGIIANNGNLNAPALEKILRFVNFCDAFHIPIITLTDVHAYENSSTDDKTLLMSGAKLIHAFANATVPKVNVILRKGIGSPYLIFNSKHLGADIVYAWPTAEISIMDSAAAEKTFGSDKPAMDASPLYVASKGYLDDIIEPAVTRKRILVALEMLATKRVSRHPKKHSSVVL